MKKKRISHNDVLADYDALTESDELLSFSMEFPHAYAAMMHTLENQTKRIVAIGKGDHVTYFDPSWYEQVQTDDYAEQQRQQLLDDADSYDQAWG